MMTEFGSICLRYRVIHSGMALDCFYKVGDLPKEAIIKKCRELGVADDENP